MTKIKLYGCLTAYASGTVLAGSLFISCRKWIGCRNKVTADTRNMVSYQSASMQEDNHRAVLAEEARRRLKERLPVIRHPWDKLHDPIVR